MNSSHLNLNTESLINSPDYTESPINSSDYVYEPQTNLPYLYDDLIVHIGTYLDAKSAMAWFATCRRYWALIRRTIVRDEVEFERVVHLPHRNIFTNLVIDFRFNLRDLDAFCNLRVLKFTAWYNSPTDLSRIVSLRSVSFGIIFDEKVSLPTGLTQLSFGMLFNQNIVLNNISALVVLKFGRCFNRPVVLPCSLRSVIFGYRFNQPIMLPNSVQYAKFGACFDAPVVWPPGIKKITIGRFYKYKLPDIGKENIKYI